MGLPSALPFLCFFQHQASGKGGTYTLRGDGELELREVNSHSDREFGLEPAFRLPVLPWPFRLSLSASHVHMVFFALPQNKIRGAVGGSLDLVPKGP